ncbi:MAG: SMC-Scp complex subunit ScpB [Oscillospiraceae bacterium]|nr:SMC-Scp complex subunit ScpB [Oscillospiraceae bacterium]
MTEKQALLEAVLFACGDPAEPERIAVAADIDKGALPGLVDSLNDAYAENGSSLTVLRLSGFYQLAVRSEYYDAVKRAVDTKKNAPLSQAAMEALTVIAYNQPVTKSFVEHIRGVDSSGVVNALVEKGLVTEAGRLDLPGRPIAYITTDAFLRCFGLESLDDLPSLPGDKDADVDDEIASIADDIPDDAFDGGDSGVVG